MHVHENVKNSVLEFIRAYLENKHFVEPEFFVGSKRIDIAFRNLKFLGEVEPNETKKETEGIPQLEEYAELVLKTTGYDKVYGAVFWAVDDKGNRWDVEVYEFFVEDGKQKKKLLGKDKETLKRVILSISKDKIPLTPFNFLLLFYPLKELFFENLTKLYERFKDEQSVKPLISAYRNALEIIYGKEVSEEKLKKLFLIHTLIQLIANAILSYILDGEIGKIETLTGKYKRYSVSLPFLEWLYILYEAGKLDKSILEEFLKEVKRRILALDWSQKAEDIFRLLYEEFISPEDRRTFGEYYTPLWLVKFMLDKLGYIKEKTVLDPFCGSGTFLDEALRRKILSGKNPKEAIREIIGFDVNPIAVMLARAEILLTYRILTKEEEYPTPLIFYVNSVEFFTPDKKTTGKLFTQGEKKKPVFLYHVKELVEVLNLSKFQHTKVSLEDLESFEKATRYVLEEISKEKVNRAKKLRKTIEKVTRINPKLKYFFDAINQKKLIELIEKYGDGVWAVSISSLFAVYLVRSKNVDITVSNPPWIHLTEVKGEYGELLRSLAKEMLKKGDPSRAVIQAGNIASVFLGAFIKLSNKTFFVMPESVVYDGSTHGAGKVLTLRAIEKYFHKLFRVNYDAFKHGEKACLILAGEGEREGKIYEIKPKTHANKEDENVELEEKELKESFKESVERVLSYFGKQEFEKVLNVDKVYKKGTFILGLFGGERKKGKEEYAGLVLEDLIEGFPPKVKLYNTSSYIELFEKEYLKKVIVFRYVRPFHLIDTFAILSDKGEEDLKELLGKIKDRASPEDRKLIDGLIKEVKQSKLLKLNPEKWYVVYRGKRSFVSVVLKGDRYTIIESDLSYVESSKPEVAYYYSGVLNYLVSKVEKGFIRNQFARPLLAIIKAGLEWKKEDWQYEVSELSQKLHELAKKEYQNLNAKRIEPYIQALENLKEWKRLKEILNKNVKNLDEAIREVAG
ncbi:MAG TPA: SAM-dependent DNA methyltransferase [Aquifex aeolicus]|nr:SAM-dependent DNA methyltransferase [Aquifex aeolicus]